MKILIAAVALIVAVPAAAYAQTQPAHTEHDGGGHGEDHKDCCKHKHADGTPMDCCKPGKDGKRPACCDKHEAKAEHSRHSGHH